MLKILIVDDNKEIRDLLKIALAGPYTVHTASSMYHARRILSSKHIDIVFLDVWLKGKDGTELVHWINKRRLPCKIILITGDAMYDISDIAPLIDGTLYKPFNLKDVLHIAATALQKKLENISKDHLQD